ncbi:MAG: hypothetical protein JXQ81_11080 [Desulfuromonadales bacterium]|nr:hypothetical protein [Desulfuromonadales bacterium]MBN2793041.1 hypothetical protein [Desulfuromonadales bacterium]
MLTSLYCSHCDQRTLMEIIEVTGQSNWQDRPFFERTYRCRKCGRKINTIEVLADDVYECDQMRTGIEKNYACIETLTRKFQPPDFPRLAEES